VVEKIPVRLTAQREAELRRYLKDKITAIRSGLKELHETKLVRWRKAYDAVPASPSRDFPFKNASNLVVPLIAIHSDTLLARVMASRFKLAPFWSASLVGDFPAKMEEVRAAFESHMQYIGIEPSMLDLYRVYRAWYGEVIKYGTSTVKAPWDQQVEDVYMASGDTSGSYQYYPRTVYEGSRPEKIPFTDFGIPPSSPTCEAANFKYHRLRYQRDELEERAYRGLYSMEKDRQILEMPDRTSPDYINQETETDSGARTVSGYGWAEYDVYECHFMYRLGRNFTRLIVWYNESNDVILRAFHNYYPDDPFIMARMFYRDDHAYGYGFAEALGMMQEEVSQIHNQRRDNSTIANTMVWRLDPNSNLNAGYDIYPGATIPAAQGEIEGLRPGQPSPMQIDEEQLTLELADRRSGVSAPMQGMGAGVMNKRGVYSSMGTLSLLQEGNTRTDLNITDMHYAHTKLGRIIARQEAEFGMKEGRFKRYGKAAALVMQALQGIKDGTLCIPVRASTASVNLEVEKQNDIMLTQLAMKHYDAITKMMQTAQNQMLPPDVQQYLRDAINSANYLMTSVFRHFGHDDPKMFVPPVPEEPPQGPPPGLPPGMMQHPALMSPDAAILMAGSGGGGELQ